MSDHIFLGNRASNVDVSPTFQTYSKVIIHISDEQAIEVGNNTGRTLEIDNPFGTRQMAQDLLNRINGYQYQPFTADGALLNPAAEIGDTISASTAYGMIFTRNKQFGRLMKTDISAPCDEEINHEYTFETPEERKFARVTGEMRASIILTQNAITTEVARANQAEGQLSTRITQTADAITSEVTRATTAEGQLSSRISQTATEISAKVSQTGGNNSTFGWSLKATEFGLYSGNAKVFWVNSTGAHVKGEITATSGQIGGFSINQYDMRFNNLAWGDTTKNYGVYIGQSGIQLGKNFKVDNGGNLVAKSGTFGSLSVNSSGYTQGTLGSLSVSSGGTSYSGGLSGCGGSVSSNLSWGAGSGYSTLGGLKSTVDEINANYITAGYITANYGSALSGTFSDLTVAHNTWDYVNLTVVTGVNFASQTYSTTTRRFWITEGY